MLSTFTPKGGKIEITSQIKENIIEISIIDTTAFMQRIYWEMVV